MRPNTHVLTGSGRYIQTCLLDALRQMHKTDVSNSHVGCSSNMDVHAIKDTQTCPARESSRATVQTGAPTLHEPSWLQQQVCQAASHTVPAVACIKASSGIAALPHAQGRSQQLQAVADQLQLWPLTHCTPTTMVLWSLRALACM